MSAVQQSIDVSCPPGPSSKPAAAALLVWTHTGTDGHYIVAHTPCSGGPSHADFMLIYANGARCRTVGGVTKTVVTESRRDADGNVTTTTTETTSTDDDVRTTITAAVATIRGPIYKIAYDLS